MCTPYRRLLWTAFCFPSAPSAFLGGRAGIRLLVAAMCALLAYGLFSPPAAAGLSYFPSGNPPELCLVYGSITDQRGVGIPYAAVCSENGDGTQADSSGRFQLQLTPGFHVLTASAVGLAPEVKRVEIPHLPTFHLDWRLSSDPLTLPEARVIIPKGGPAFWPGRTVLTRREWAAAGSESLPEVLELIPGMTILKGDGRLRASLRGAPPRTVTAHLDGVPLNDPGTGEADLSEINLDDLDRIQVDYAGLGGGITMYSSPPAVDPGRKFKVEGQVTQTGGHGWRVKTEHRALGRAAWSAQAQVQDEPGGFRYRDDSGAVYVRTNNRRRSWGTGVRAAWLAGNWSLEASADLNRVRRGSPGLIYGPPTPQAALDTRQSNLRVGLRRDFPDAVLRLSTFNQSHYVRYTNPAQVMATDSGAPRVWSPAEDDLRTGNRFGLVVGFQGRAHGQEWHSEYRFQRDTYLGEDRIRGGMVAGIIGLGAARVDLHRIEGAVTAERPWKGWIGRIRPEGGVTRLQSANGRLIDAGNAAIAAQVLRPTRWGHWSGGASWSRNLVPPNYNAQFAVDGVFVAGNPRLKPERGTGWDWHLGAQGSARRLTWSVDLNAYRRRITDLLVWRRNFQGRYYPDNLGAAGLEGGEATVAVNSPTTGLGLRGKLALTRAVNLSPGDINYGRRIPLTAPTSGAAGLSYNCGAYHLTLTSQWAARRFSTESNQDPLSTAGMGLPPYTVWNLRLKRDFVFKVWRTQVAVQVDNLTDQNYRLIERSPMPGRTWTLETSLSRD